MSFVLMGATEGNFGYDPKTDSVCMTVQDFGETRRVRYKPIGKKGYFEKILRVWEREETVTNDISGETKIIEKEKMCAVWVNGDIKKEYYSHFSHLT
ncbi:MAG: hypothetical protein PHU12_00340 [Candidatus Aenigmarchaeota archaeon]|nr:hypothetical protein [Candidatus Aenigmarchaeota archaeon]